MQNSIPKTMLCCLVITVAMLSLYCDRDKSITGTGSGVPADSLVKEWKPNIYIYPEETTQVSVRLDFPQGGHITASEPAYPESGWNVTVTPEGVIDNTWRFLFYESETPNQYQTETGWLVARPELEAFFESSLRLYSLNGQEIADFIDYWVPRLTNSPYYLVYPQTRKEIDPLIALQVLPPPHNLQRLYFYFQAANASTQPPTAPVPKGIDRTGYTVIEWGGILDDNAF